MKKFILSACCILNITVYAQPGFLDNTFGTGGKVITPIGNGNNGYNWSVAIQADNKIVVVGRIYNGSDLDFALVRYNSDGTLDNTFDSDGKVTTDFGNTNDIGFSVAIQSDGKIVVAGCSGNGSDLDFALARYNSDGSLDNAFGSAGKIKTDFGFGSDDYGQSVVIQSDGKIVVAGASGYSPNSDYDFALARYNSDGTLDATFDSDGKVITVVGFSGSGWGNSVCQQSDGKIVMAGYSYVGTAYVFAVVRYNNDGTLDNTFSSDGKVTTAIGSSDSKCYSVATQSDGKIVVVGYTNNGSPNDDVALVRYNSDGSLDNTFDSDGIITTAIGSGFDHGFSVAIQSDDKIVVVGNSYNGINGDFALIRYKSDGTLDNTFGTGGKVLTDFGFGSDDYGQSVVIQSDGKIVVAGWTSSGFVYNIALARYDGGTVGIEENTEMNDVSIYPNPTSGIFTVNIRNCRDAKICVYDVLGNCLLNKDCRNDVSSKINLSCQPRGIYFVELLSGENRVVRKVAVQ